MGSASEYSSDDNFYGKEVRITVNSNGYNSLTIVKVNLDGPSSSKTPPSWTFF